MLRDLHAVHVVILQARPTLLSGLYRSPDTGQRTASSTAVRTDAQSRLRG